MEIIAQFVDIFLHLDVHLTNLTAAYGIWIYVILFAIIFCETGLVVTPFLPGDSLLFAAGALAALDSLSLPGLLGLLTVAAILGDTVNYWFGAHWGLSVFARFLKKEHLDKTHQFYEKYGPKTIVLARFVPIVRTLAPFVAGIGSMTYATFISYNIAGGVLWIFSCVIAGYFFGNIPIVKQNFSVVLLVIVGISVLPAVIEFIKHRRENKEPVRR